MNEYQKLANAIVVQAAVDYQKSLCKIKELREKLARLEDVVTDCETLFDSNTLCLYTNLDGTALKERLRSEVVMYEYNYEKILEAHKGK